MNRRELLRNTAVLGAAALPFAAAGGLALRSAAGPGGTPDADAGLSPLAPPAQGGIPVAFLLSRGAVVIDFCGPWSVFESTQIPGRDDMPFRLYTVAETREPVTASMGLKVLPDFTLATAPAPKVIVIPAQADPSPATLDWLRRAAPSTDVTMSVCTGAFLLAKTGLLDGKEATTHHNAYTQLAMQFPDIRVKRGARFVEAGKVATAGGLSSGIDLALRVVARYFGRDTAIRTAAYMEYQGQGWTDPNSNEAYRQRLVSTAEHPLCPVCDMEVDPKTALRSDYRGHTFYFCMPDHQSVFERAPQRFVPALAI